MKTSVGIDIVDVKDFERRMKRTPSLAARIFTDYEMEYCSRKGIEHLASRFAAKEAFAKASGMKNLAWKDVEIRNSPTGKPLLNLKRKKNFRSADLSISNIRKLSVAVVVLTY